MLTLKQWVEMRLAVALKELDAARATYKRLEAAAILLEQGKEPSRQTRQAYTWWSGLQPKEPPAARGKPAPKAGEGSAGVTCKWFQRTDGDYLSLCDAVWTHQFDFALDKALLDGKPCKKCGKPMELVPLAAPGAEKGARE